MSWEKSEETSWIKEFSNIIMNCILNIISQYKRTSAFISVFELGVLEYIYINQPVDISDISKDLKIDKQMLGLLLEYASAEKIFEKKNNKWSVGGEWNAQIGNLDKFKHIIEHEKRLFYKWINPDSINSVVKRGLGKRKFDQHGMTKSEIEIYCKAMYGKNVNLISLWINRTISRKSSLKILEYGRSPGVIIRELLKQRQVSQCTIVLDEAFIGIYRDSYSEYSNSCSPEIYPVKDFDFTGKYDVICIFNTIHYYSKNELHKLCVDLKKIMDENSILCIIDIFLKPDNNFQATLVLDWMTHGGVYNLYVEDAISLLEETGFLTINHKYINEINTDILFCKKRTGFE